MINSNKVVQNILGTQEIKRRKLKQDNEEKLIKTIEIDCAPLGPRPDVYMKQICAETDLEYKKPYISPVGFGNWEWDYSELSDEEWLKIKPKIGEMITNFYNQGSIRYGSW